MMAKRIRYAEPGTLSRPGPIGRAIRFILGAFCVYLVVAILTQASPFFTGRALHAASVWVLIFIGLYLFPDVVNLGFGKAWKRFHLLLGLVALAGVTALVGWAMNGSTVGPPLGTLVSIWLLYVFGHLGISFLLAAFQATPGCEMRSIPQLWAVISGKPAQEHYCPGVLTPIDRWEAKRGARRRGERGPAA